MQAVSDAFDAAVIGSHSMAVRADVMLGGQIVAADVAIEGGAVTLDRLAANRGRCTLSLAEPLRTDPRTSPLTPYGYEVRVWRGVAFTDGTTELVPLGTFPIQDSDVSGRSQLTVLSLLDRSQRVVEARFEDDYSIAAGTNTVLAIQALIEAGVPDLEYALGSTAETTPLLTMSAWSDRWEAAQAMATTLNSTLAFDALGRLVRTPTPIGDPVAAWELVEGGLLLDAAVRIGRREIYNRVVAESSNSSLATVYRGVATDDNPASTTYYYGPFGRRPRGYASPFIASQAAADSAAAAILADSLGTGRSYQLSAVPHPALEPGDVVLVRHSGLGLNALMTVDAVTFGLRPADPMTLDVRLALDLGEL